MPRDENVAHSSIGNLSAVCHLGRLRSGTINWRGGGRAQLSDSKSHEFSFDIPSFVAGNASTKQISIPIANSTGRLVEFKKIRTSCACASANLSSNRLEPGAAGNLDVVLNISGRSGDQHYLVSLFDQSENRWDYRIHARIFERIRFGTNGNVLSLGEWDPGDPIHRTIQLAFSAESQQQLPKKYSVGCDSKEVHVAIGQPADHRVCDAIWTRTIPVAISLVAPQQAGPFRFGLTAKVTIDEIPESKSISLTGCTKAAFEASPKYVVFGRESEGPIQKKF